MTACRSTRFLSVACAALCLALTGCESFQRKFTRRKRAQPPPTPVINFQDYTRTMTPLDRYRKHYLIFDYWNQELINALQSPPLNSKRFKLASKESLGELQTLRDLLVEEVGERFVPLIEEREKINRQLQHETVSLSQVNATTRALEAQAREIHRSFFWRTVQDQLKPMQAPGDAPAP